MDAYDVGYYDAYHDYKQNVFIPKMKNNKEYMAGYNCRLQKICLEKRLNRMFLESVSNGKK